MRKSPPPWASSASCGRSESAALSHPHILPLFDSGEADGLLYYVMPYVEGATLRGRLDRERQLPIEDAVRIAQEIAAGLGYAHARGIVHRDIKPENLMLHRAIDLNPRYVAARYWLALLLSLVENRYDEGWPTLGVLSSWTRWLPFRSPSSAWC